MKAPFKIIAGVLIVIGLVIAAAVLVTAGRPLLGLDLGSAAILVVGGCVLWALGNAVNLLRLVRDELRRQRSAATPPWLREAPAPAETKASAKAAAKAAARASAAPVATENLREQLGEQPMIATESQRPKPQPAEATPSPVAVADKPQPPEAQATERVEASAQTPPVPAQPEPVEPAGASLAAELDETEEAAPQEPVELYVVEERMFRGKPARVLSDGTIEAETDEGWMRFEDFDHLREYMDAAAAMRR